MVVGKGVGEEVRANKCVKNDSEIVPSRGLRKWDNMQMILGIKNYYQKKKRKWGKSTFFIFLKYHCLEIIGMIKGESHHSPATTPSPVTFFPSLVRSRSG